MNWAEIELTGWGRNARGPARACRPERMAELPAAIAAAEDGGIIPRGAGRAYGDAALNSGGRVLLTRRLDRITGFDPETGEAVCEPGVTFRDLLDTFLPHGYIAPASPGTAFTTIGGAIANDIHGKNHDWAGSFGDHVRWFDLLTADGNWRRVSPGEDPELFAATIGGAGLTGLVTAVNVRLLSGATSHVVVKEQRIRDLDSFLAAFAEVRDRATFSVGWIDALAGGASFGRGILETAEFATAEEAAKARPSRPRARRVPFDAPGFVLNPLGVRLFNALYFRRVPAGGRERLRPFGEFLYPLDAIHDWNRIYGRRGFYQFQCALPDAEAGKGLRALMYEIQRSRGASFLAVLKTLGAEGRGHLSFPLRGVTLALDFPRRSGTVDLMRTLEAIALDHGGRIYLAKDSVLSAEGFRAMYPKLPRFLRVLDQVDPEGRFTSDLARRLGIRSGRAVEAA